MQETLFCSVLDQPKLCNMVFHSVCGFFFFKVFLHIPWILTLISRRKNTWETEKRFFFLSIFSLMHLDQFHSVYMRTIEGQEEIVVFPNLKYTQHITASHWSKTQKRRATRNKNNNNKTYWMCLNKEFLWYPNTYSNSVLIWNQPLQTNEPKPTGVPKLFTLVLILAWHCWPSAIFSLRSVHCLIDFTVQTNTAWGDANWLGFPLL